MFDESTYRETFAALHASETTKTEVMNMARQAETTRIKRLPRRALTLAAAIVLLLALGMTAYAAAGYEIPWWSVVSRQPELRPRAEDGAALLCGIAQLRGEEPELEITGRMAHWDEPGSSDVYEYYYRMQRRSVSVGYYGTGELRSVDLRALFDETHPGYSLAVAYWKARFPDARAYAEQVEQAAPGVLNEMYAREWAQGGSGEIEAAWCNARCPFWEWYTECFLVMHDGSAYELWLKPDTLEIEGFRYYKPEDMPAARGGLLAAVRDGTAEEWYANFLFSGGG